MKKIFLILLSSIILFSCIVNISFAADASGTTGTTGTVTLKNPLTNIDTPQALIGNILKGALGLVGSLALAMFIYGGLTMMLSSGGEGVKKGKEIIVWATIGLIVIFSAYALVSFLFSNVLGTEK